MDESMARLRRFIVNYYSREEVRTLCFDLGVRYDVLGGEGLEARVRELLLHLGRRRRFDDLLHYLERTRPAAFAELGFSGDGDRAEALYAALPSPDDEPPVPLPVETKRRGRNWQFVLRAVAVLSWVVAVVWFLVEGGFEPLLAVLSGVAFFLGSFAVDGDREQAGPDDAALIARNRRISSALVEKVRAVWIRGVLEQNLHEMARLELGLAEKPGAVERPWAMALERVGEEERPLPPGTTAADVFRELGGAMLILGAPGSGKTITLLQLAERMLEEAELNPARPVPLVLNLSSWAERRLPLAEWLVEELHMMYGVSKKVSPAWLAGANYTLLLDGLDEVAAGQREACVEAINSFHRENGFRQIVVCSRTGDYQRLRARLQLMGAVVIRPLTAEQVDDYLTAGGQALAAARAAVPRMPCCGSWPRRR